MPYWRTVRYFISSGLQYDCPEESTKYYLIKDGKLIELEKDEHDFSEI